MPLSDWLTKAASCCFVLLRVRTLDGAGEGVVGAGGAGDAGFEELILGVLC